MFVGAWTGCSGEAQPRDERAPAVVGTWPVDGTTVDATRPTVLAAFDEAIDPASVGPATLELHGPAGEAVEVTPTVVATAIAIAPRFDLPPGRYQVRLRAGVADLAGNALPADQAWQFTVTDHGDHAAPHIVYRSPADGAVGVSLTAQPTVFFDEPIALRGTSGLTLHDAAGAAVAASVDLVGTGLVATPTAPLAPFEHYTVTVDPGVTDLAGNALVAAQTWGFDTAAVTAWSAPRPLAPSSQPSGDVDVAAAGGARVVGWIEGRQQAWLSRELPAGWSAPEPVAPPSDVPLAHLQLGLTDAGTTQAGWTVTSGPGAGVWFSASSAAGVWSAPIQIGTPAAWHGEFAFDPHTGAAVVAWNPRDEAALRVRRYLPGTGWSSDEVVPFADPGVLFIDERLRIGVDDAGRVGLAWIEDSGSARRLVVATRGAAGWSAPTVLDASVADGDPPELAMARGGRLVLGWEHLAGGVELHARVWTEAGGWSAPEVVHGGTPQGATLRLAANDDGVVAVWTEWPGASLHGRRWTPGGGWTPATAIDVHPGGAWAPRIAIAADGHAAVAWQRRPTTGPTQLWAATAAPDGTWTREPVAIDAVGVPSFGAPLDVVVDATGAVVAWLDLALTPAISDRPR